MTKIKWNRIKEIIKEITGYKEVEILLSTEVDDDYRASVVYQPNKKVATIVLNSLYNKNEKHVIESIAHETAHILTHTQGDFHPPKFYKMYKEIKNTLIKECRDKEER